MQLFAQMKKIVTTHARIYGIELEKDKENGIVANEEIEVAIQEINQLKKIIDDYEKKRNRLIEKVKSYMGTREKLVNTYNEELATWRYAKGASKPNLKSLQTNHPELYSSYIEIGEPVRKFLVKD